MLDRNDNGVFCDGKTIFIQGFADLVEIMLSQHTLKDILTFGLDVQTKSLFSVGGSFEMRMRMLGTNFCRRLCHLRPQLVSPP